MDCRSTRLAGGAVPCASEESRMPETAELTALPDDGLGGHVRGLAR
jgi:hypothetical protein